MKLDICPFDLRLSHKWAIARSSATGGGSTTARSALVRLRDGEISGLGEAPATVRYAQSADSIEKFLRSIDPARLSFSDIPASMAYLDSVAPDHASAKCAVNAALVDGAARKAGQAVYEFLDLGFTEGKHLTSFSIGIDSPKTIRQKVAEAEPYPVLKLKLGSPQDRENLAALREVAPQKIVRVDANEAWTTKEDALRNIEWLAADSAIEFVEQPMPATHPIADFAWLKSRSPLPIFGDESYHRASDAAACAESFHGVNVKLIKTGGITAAFDALQAARKAGLKTMIGCMIESSILISAAAHLAELTDHLDIDGNLLISNDPFTGPTARGGLVSFTNAEEKLGLRVKERDGEVFD
jgi:L-alanine-DL-glutamate epimerase-like enolase superfamily enzyme